MNFLDAAFLIINKIAPFFSVFLILSCILKTFSFASALSYNLQSVSMIFRLPGLNWRGNRAYCQLETYFLPIFTFPIVHFEHNICFLPYIYVSLDLATNNYFYTGMENFGVGVSVLIFQNRTPPQTFFQWVFRNFKSISIYFL